MRKICIVATSRANYARLKSVIKAVKKHPELELQLVKGASALEIKTEYEPDAVIQCLVEGDNHQAMTLTTGLFITQLGNMFDRLKPDFVLVHGDRYEVLGVALTAAYMNISIGHTEGGEITGTIDERVRHAVTKLADVHFVVTDLARKRVIAMGERPEMVFTVGSTALDSLTNINLSNNRKEPYMVILHHPNTTKHEDISELIYAINCINMHKVWVNPNVDAGSKAMLKLIHQQDVEFVKNLPPEEYARLIYNCKCLVGNTSSGIKEGAFLGVPYVCVGDRQKGREKGPNVLEVPNVWRDIVGAINEQIGKKYEPCYMFGDGTAGKKIADILSYIETGEKKLCLF